MSDEITAWVAVINGKPDFFFMCRGSHKLKRRIEKYLHLSIRQFFAIGNYIRKASKTEMALYEPN